MMVIKYEKVNEGIFNAVDCIDDIWFYMWKVSL